MTHGLYEGFRIPFPRGGALRRFGERNPEAVMPPPSKREPGLSVVILPAFVPDSSSSAVSIRNALNLDPAKTRRARSLGDKS